MDIEKVLKEKNALLFLTSKANYSAKLIEIVKALNENFSKICYVNMNKNNKPIKNLLKRRISPKNLYIITIHKMRSKNGLETKIIKSPADLAGINIAFSDFVYRGCRSFLFDSLSCMMPHVKQNELLKFIHTLIVKSKTADTQFIFLALNEDINSNMFNELSMLFDDIITS